MNASTDEKQPALLKLQKLISDIEIEQKNGARYYSVDELDATLRRIIDNF